MRRRSLACALAVPAAAAGLAAGAAFAAPAAHAQTANTDTDTGGTVAITVPESYIAQLAKAGVVEFPVPASELSVDHSSKTVTVTFTVTGGDADISVFSGSLDLSGTVDVAGVRHPHPVTLGSLQLDVFNGQLDATPAGSSTPVPLLDVAGNTSFTVTPGATSAADTYSSDEMTVDPAGAAYLNSALGTSAFQAGQNVGTMSASWTVTNPS